MSSDSPDNAAHLKDLLPSQNKGIRYARTNSEKSRAIFTPPSFA